MHSNRYTFIYSICISVLTAIVLVVTSVSLKPQQDFNIALDTKSNILKSVLIEKSDPKEIEDIYGKEVTELVVNSRGEVLNELKAKDILLKEELAKPLEKRNLPLYVHSEVNGKKNYVIPLQGVGLWGPIWGFIAIESDFNTVKGSFFDHKSETPGLGAEISEKLFQNQFVGKKLKDASNRFISVRVVKKSAKVDFTTENRVDGISGGTITSDGTDLMIKNCIAPYLVYFDKLKTNK